jgi:hypothetical protein
MQVGGPGGDSTIWARRRLGLKRLVGAWPTNDQMPPLICERHRLTRINCGPEAPSAKFHDERDILALMDQPWHRVPRAKTAISRPSRARYVRGLAPSRNRKPRSVRS